MFNKYVVCVCERGKEREREFTFVITYIYSWFPQHGQEAASLGEMAPSLHALGVGGHIFRSLLT